MSTQNITSSDAGYVHQTANCPHTSNYIWKPVIAACQGLQAKNILDLGCGNGALCREMISRGFVMSGCDPSESGIAHAQQACPGAEFKVLGVYDDPSRMGRSDFDAVISTEVAEHLFYPKFLPRFARQVLKPGGHFILTTPYHGYLKNLMLSIFDHWDVHHTPLWDGGHIKFWSRKTLTKMLEDEGFKVTQFIGAGRLPYLWMSMVLVARKVN